MRVFKTLTTRLVLSHLAVSIVSISLMATFAGRYLFQAVIAEAEHNLQGLAVAAGNAIELPIEDLRAGRATPRYIKDLLARLFADIDDLQFTVFTVTGTPIVDSTDTLPNVYQRTRRKYSLPWKASSAQHRHIGLTCRAIPICTLRFW
jgi:hypothetical protein